MAKRIINWLLTLIHGPVVHCRCGSKRAKGHRCPDCGRLYRRQDGERNRLPGKIETDDEMTFDFDA